MFKRIFAASIISIMASLPALSQETPTPGGSLTGAEDWLSTLPSGTWFIVGGVLFFVTGEGIVNAEGAILPAPTPAPTPAPPAATTTTS